MTPIQSDPLRISAPSTPASHLYVLIPCTLVLFVFVWMTTSGTFDLARADFLGRFFDAQADAFMQGRWDIPRDSIFPEEFIHDGKFYGYAGFVPALPRMLLNHFFPTMDGAWSRTSVCVACLVTLLFSYELLLIGRRWLAPGQPMGRGTKALYSLFLMLVGLGSTTIFLGSKSFMYHEAMIWGVAFSLGFYAQLLEYFLTGRSWRLGIACVLAWLSFFSRISTGSGPFLALLLVGIAVIAWRGGGAEPGPIRRAARSLGKWSSPPPLLHALAAWSAVGVILATYVWVNHSKFGTWFEAVPMHMYQIFHEDPDSARRAGWSWMHIGNIPTTAYAYFWPGNVDFRPQFPWIWMTLAMKTFSCSQMGGRGAYASLPTTMPVLLMFALAGLVVLRARARISRHSLMYGSCRVRAESEAPDSSSIGSSGKDLRSAPGIWGGEATSSREIRPPDGLPFPPLILLSSLAVIGLILCFFNVDHRYLHEFLPVMVILGAFGVNLRLNIPSFPVRAFLIAALIVASTFEIYTNVAFALEYQRQFVFEMAREQKPAKEWLRWQKAVDGYVDRFLPRQDPPRRGKRNEWNE